MFNDETRHHINALIIINDDDYDYDYLNSIINKINRNKYRKIKKKYHDR